MRPIDDAGARVTDAFSHALTELGISSCAVGDRCGVSESRVRNIRGGGAPVTLAMLLCAGDRVLDRVLSDVREPESEAPSGRSIESHGRKIVALVGELSGMIDEAIADGRYDDVELDDLAKLEANIHESLARLRREIKAERKRTR